LTASAHLDATRPLPLSGPPSRGLWANVWRQLIHKKRAVFGLIVIALFTFVAILAPLLAPHDPLELGFGRVYLPPAWVKPSPAGPGGDPRFLLGTDTQGRDLLSRLIYGTQASIFVGLIAAPLVALAGTFVGVTAGYLGGRTETALMRVADVFYAFPSIMFYILIALIFRATPMGQWLNGLLTLLLALVLVGWAGLAMLTRSAVLSIKESQFIEAARCSGASHRYIMFRHVLPNCAGLIAVWAAFAIPRLIMVEAILGYLGVGLTQTADSSQSFFVTSWGGLFLDGRMALNTHPLILLAPALCLVLLGLAFTFLGDALRDALDPRLHGLI